MQQLPRQCCALYLPGLQLFRPELVIIMATVIVTMKVMPVSPDENLDAIKAAASQLIVGFGGTVGKVDFEPIAFGLKAVVFMFAMDESLGGTEDLEAKMGAIKGVESVQTTDVRRAIG